MNEENRELDEKIEKNVAKINQLNGFINDESIKNSAAINTYNTALLTKNVKDIAKAIEEANKLEEGHMYKAPLLGALTGMMQKYANITYKDYITKTRPVLTEDKLIKIDNQIDENITKINKLNSFIIDENVKNTSAMETYNIAIKTKNLDDIEKALEEAKKLDDSHMYKAPLLGALNAMATKYAAAQNEEIIEPRIDTVEEKKEESISETTVDAESIDEPIEENSIIETTTEEADKSTKENVVEQPKEATPVNESTEIVPYKEKQLPIPVTKFKDVAEEKPKSTRPIVDKDERIFTDEERIDSNHKYLTAANAKNLRFLNEDEDFNVHSKFEPIVAIKKAPSNMISKAKKLYSDLRIDSYLVLHSQEYNLTHAEMAQLIIDDMVYGKRDTDGNIIDINQQTQDNSRGMGRAAFTSISAIALLSALAAIQVIVLGILFTR